jgi:hypothetical protein
LKKLLLKPNKLPLSSDLEDFASDHDTTVVTDIEQVFTELDSEDFTALCFTGEIDSSELYKLNYYLNSEENFNHPVLPVFAMNAQIDENIKSDLESLGQFHFFESIDQLKNSFSKIPKKEVLIIHDKESELVRLKGELEGNSFKTSVAKDLDTALEQLLKTHPMCVIIFEKSISQNQIKVFEAQLKSKKKKLGYKVPIITLFSTDDDRHLGDVLQVYMSLAVPLEQGTMSHVLKELFYSFDVVTADHYYENNETIIESEKEIITENIEEDVEVLENIVNKQDEFGRTPIMKTALSGNVLKTRDLLMSGAGLEYKDNNEKTVFSYAVEKGDFILIELLLNNGALQNAYSRESDPVVEILKKGNDKLYPILFKYSPNLNRTFKGAPYLIHAIERDDKKFFELLLKHGAQPLRRGKDGRNCLDVIRDKKLIDYLDIVQKNIKASQN